MAFSNEVLRKALEKVEQRRKINEAEYERKKQTLYISNPELKSIETDMQIKSSSLALSTLSGNIDVAARLLDEITLLKKAKEKIEKAAKLPDCPDYTCKKCNDSGYIGNALCSCVKDIAADLSYSSLISEMPLKESTFQGFDLTYYNETKNENGFSPKKQMTAVLKVCKDFADNFPCGANLLLTGKSGLGKTHLSLSIANEVLSKDYHVIYGSAQNLINEVSREAFDRTGSTEKIDSLTSCDLLILDDLGTEFTTQLSVSVVYNIINTRLLRGLSTIISTNLNIKEISDFYNERIASRIIGNYSICTFFGDDIRQIKAMEKNIKK